MDILAKIIDIFSQLFYIIYEGKNLCNFSLTLSISILGMMFYFVVYHLWLFKSMFSNKSIN